IYGIPLNTPLNFERVTKVIHPDDFENHKKEIEVWVQNKKVTPYEYRIIQPDGSIRYIYGVGNIEFNKKGEPVRLYGTLQDVTVQKETEHKLQIAKEKAEEGESYLDNILNNFGDPVFVKDDQSRLILVNDAFCRVFNRVKKDIIGKTLAEDVSPNEVENFLRVDKQVLKTGKESITEESLTIRGGETRIISTRKTRYVDNSGKRHIIGVIRDITDRKHAEEQVKETLMQLNMAVDTAKIGVWTHNIKTDELFWNNELFEIFGLSPSEFDRSPEAFKKMVHPEDFECVMEQHGKGLQNKSVAGFEFRIIRPNKEVRYIYASVTPIFDKEKNLIKVAGINLDITEQKTSEKALKESKTRFEILSNVTFEGILIHDKGVPIDLNSSFPKMFGYTRDEFLKHNLVELIIKKEHQNIILKNVNSEYRFPYEVIGIKKDGTEFPIEIEGRSFINEENKKLRVAAIRDISERKKAKEKLEQANLELIEAVSSLNELKKQLEDQNIYLKKELDLVFNFEEMVYGSALFSEVLTDLERVAPTDATVLVLGESGTGKELLARALHNLSLRKQKPFIKVNCSAIPTELIESELFGHKKGSFTGAVSDKVGKFELADGGTLFLDEIGDLPLSMQPKLLRFLQEGEMEVVGGTTTRSLNVRIVAATNKDLKLEVNNGQFREDLYFRLNVFPIVVPALRERKEDVPLLVEHFINKFGKKYRKKIKYISDSAMQDLKVYNWPGNIRELENLIERAIILSDNETLNIPGFGSAKTKKSRPISGAKMTLDDVQRNHILSVLEKTNWKVDGPDGAATILDIKPSTFRDKMKKLGIKRPN
ncbi:MAG: sigma 54-interacting transcriptional regulator, partial [Bacteroidia bacterium]|nr:sigma 54-interacting transcriptional regulator [Bacteroidia bacterium]